jgi:hypothetical protein
MLPQPVLQILKIYLRKVEHALPGFLKGFYVYGSCTLNDFYSYKSDIDFIAVPKTPPSGDEIKILERIHRRLQRNFPKPNMNGMYLDAGSIGKRKEDVKSYPYFFEGRMYTGGHMELSKVTWYQLKNNASAVLGAEPYSFNFNVTPEELKEEMRENINEYWKVWLNRHTGFAWRSALLLHSSLVEWGVLGVSRQYYTMLTGGITSKAAAGKFCLQNAPSEYKQILEEAVCIREGKPSKYSSKLKRRKDTVKYMKYVIDNINRNF